MRWLLRKLPIVAALIAFGVAFVWLDQDKQFRRDSFKPYSLHNISETGCSLAFRYLKERRAGKGAELNRTVELGGLEANAVLYRLGPQVVPGEHEDRESVKDEKKSKLPKVPKADPEKPLLTPGEKTWVENGGRLVLAIEGIYGPLESLRLVTSADVRKVFPIWAGVNAPTAASARMLSGAPLADAHTLLMLGGDVYAARIALGKGDVILFAAPDIFSNAFLANGSNLQLLAALHEPARPFYFDEYVHELQSAPGMLEMLTRWGFGMALVSFCVLSLSAFWRARSPVGPPEDPFRDTRSQAVDFVSSLAPLYDKSLSPQQALAMHYKNFLQTASAQSGLRGEALAAKIRALLSNAHGFRAEDERALAGQLELTHAEFQRLLHVLNDAFRRLELAHRR